MVVAENLVEVTRFRSPVRKNPGLTVGVGVIFVQSTREAYPQSGRVGSTTWNRKMPSGVLDEVNTRKRLGWITVSGIKEE